jgi:hypothetical protein
VAGVIIGGDPQKLPATIEIIGEREQTVAHGRFGTDRDGYKAMLAVGRKHADRLWAVEGCSGIGRDRPVGCQPGARWRPPCLAATPRPRNRRTRNVEPSYLP